MYTTELCEFFVNIYNSLAILFQGVGSTRPAGILRIQLAPCTYSIYSQELSSFGDMKTLRVYVIYLLKLL